jgi:hypothetical protein
MPNDVDAWMAKYDNPQKAVVQAVRKAILAADKRIAETIKWQSPTFMYKGNLASFNPKAKQFASLMFHTGAKIAGKFPSLSGSGDVARYMQFTSLDDVKKKAAELKRIVKAWCDQKDASA